MESKRKTKFRARDATSPYGVVAFPSFRCLGAIVPGAFLASTPPYRRAFGALKIRAASRVDTMAPRVLGLWSRSVESRLNCRDFFQMPRYGT